MSEKEREIYEFEMDLNTKSAIYILTLIPLTWSAKVSTGLFCYYP